MSAELIDTHCHLEYDYAPKSTKDLIEEASAVGVRTLITIGTDLASLPKVAEISEKYAPVFHTVGIHPHEAQTLSDADLESIQTASKHPKCVAIGEIGLDYHYEYSPKDIQIQRLKQQLEIAIEVKLPVVIHSREGEEDLLPLLRDFSARMKGRESPGVIHCFTGTERFASACVDLGFYISFSGILTFKNAENLRLVARTLPLERILVETDAPYLAPIPMRGKKCEPSMVRFTALKLAELREMPFEELAQQMVGNAVTLFKLAHQGVGN